MVAESFLPRVNGVSNSVYRVSKELSLLGHENLIVAPAAPPELQSPYELDALRVVRTEFVQFSSIPDFEVAKCTVAKLRNVMLQFQPDVVHLASPFILGWLGMRAAHSLNLPVVSIYQTDVAGFAQFYGLPLAAKLAASWTHMIHRKSNLNLVPSTPVLSEFFANGINNSKIWGRGVDLELFHPSRRDQSLRSTWTSENKKIVGFVGRLAPEKQVERLANLDTEKYQLVIIGDGPDRDRLVRLLPEAIFTGRLSGEPLAIAMASLDILISPGENETFCQVIQEAMASGIPVVAPMSGGPIDLVKPGITGYLYQPGSSTDLLAKLELLRSDNLSITTFGETARNLVVENSWSALTDQLITHYESVIPMALRQAS